MLDYIYVFIISMLPIFEVRAAIPFGIIRGLNPYIVFIIGIIGNILIIPIIFWVLKKWHFLRIAKKLFGKRAYNKIERNKKRLEKWEELALLLFVAIPLPVTGAWMGSFIATLLNMNKKKSFFVISIGVLIASLIIWGVFTGIINNFTLRWK